MTLYDTDLLAWTREQADEMRRLMESRSNVPLDLPNILEEIESLGNEQADAVESALMRIVEHLLKLEFSPAVDPRRSWRQSVRAQRINARRKLRRNPSLAAADRLGALLVPAWQDGRWEAVESLTDHGESDAAAAIPAECPYTLEQLLDPDWLPANRHGL